jgi:hypothetical protein
MTITLTLAQLEALNPCDFEGRKALYGRKRSLSAVQALEAGASISDLLWVAGRLGRKDLCVRFALLCAQRVAHLNSDPRVQAAIDAGFAWLNSPMGAAARAAWAAVGATDAAMGAAWAAVGAADAADAARAADAAARAARAADAAWAAVGAADAADATDAAVGAADAAVGAAGAAGAAEQKAQRQIFLEVFKED